jgi:anti-anti-sigma factor
MATNDVQVWKSSKFTLERCESTDTRTVLFRFVGPFTARDMYTSISPATFHCLFDLLPQRDGYTAHVIDLSGVPYMDSMGLGMIVTHFVSCRNRGIGLTITGAGPRVTELFKLAHVDNLLPLAHPA